jgi:hypothetical protein
MLDLDDTKHTFIQPQISQFDSSHSNLRSRVSWRAATLCESVVVDVAAAINGGWW